MTTPILRFAPSPNGELHLGHAYSALVTWQWAGRLSGHVYLRVEDIDPARSRQRFIDAILHDLEWLGLTWVGPVLRQSTRLAAYRSATNRLMQLGLLYPCFATRTELARLAADNPIGHDPDGAPLYPGVFRQATAAEVAERKARGEAFALRLDMERALRHLASQGRLPLTYQAMDRDGTCREHRAEPADWGDAIIVRKDTPTSYHLAVVVDDAHQRITHVTRGRDLERATDLHVLLQALLDLATPIYHHHDLVSDESGRKLSKSAGDTSLRALRQSGRSPADIRALVGQAARANS